MKNERPPDETIVLDTQNRWDRALIGKHDLTLRPLIPAGSIVLIDTRKREVLPRKLWTDPLQRPIYFLKTKDAYFCGWAELEEGQWLTLIPHPSSSAPTRRWKYGTEVENLGRVVSIVVHRETTD
jgi:hypothetical protein